MSGLSPEERSLRAKIAVHTSWANTKDPTARTAPARKAFHQRFYDQVDPDRTLPEAERERRAAHALSAHMTRLSYKASRAKRGKRRQDPLPGLGDSTSPQRSGGDGQAEQRKREGDGVNGGGQE